MTYSGEITWDLTETPCTDQWVDLNLKIWEIDSFAVNPDVLLIDVTSNSSGSFYLDTGYDSLKIEISRTYSWPTTSCKGVAAYFQNLPTGAAIVLYYPNTSAQDTFLLPSHQPPIQIRAYSVYKA